MPGGDLWELWEGELREVPGAGGWASGIAVRIASRLTLFVEAEHAGWVTGADGAFVLARDPDTVVEPDVGFVRWDRLPDRAPPVKYIPVAPDLAVEVQSPSDEPGEMARKRELYRRAGVPLQWWVDPIRRTVAAYRDGEPVADLGDGVDLDGGGVLPGFRLPIATVFASAPKPIR